MKTSDWRARAVLFVALFALISPYCPPVEAQQPAEAKAKKDAAKSDGSLNDPTRWLLMLDQLSEEARALHRKESRPLVLAEIADACWKINKEKAKDLFTSAIESALALDPASKEFSAAARRILALASRRDRDFARQLTDYMLQQRERDYRAASTTVAAALDLLNHDPQAAISLAEASALAGPSGDAAWFIFQLASVDSAAAERVYRAYLKPFAPGSAPDLGRLLWFAGYPFGYAESWGGSKKVSNMTGFGGRRITGLAPNPALAVIYLDLALRSVSATLEQAAHAPAPESDLLSSLALFAVGYLTPEAARYRPNALQTWLMLERQARSGASLAQQQIVSEHLRKISELRAKTSDYDSSQSYASNRARLDLEQAESLADGCQRDQAYAKAALGMGSSKDFTQTLAIAGKIKELPLRESVHQYIYYDMSVAAIEGGNLDEARQFAARVTARNQRTLLYVKIAEAALRKKETARAAELLRETVKQADGVEDAGQQAAVFLAAAAVYSSFDQFETDQAIKLAIKAVNRAQAQNIDDFSVLRKVSLSCSGDGYPWYGSSEKAERFSLIQSLAALAPLDVEGVILMARGIDDPAIRIRALASIVKAVTKS